MAHIEFDANEYEPMGSFDPIPVGEYLVVISDSDIKPTSKGTGKYLQLVYDVIDGEYQGRKLFDRLNILNENDTAQKIGKSQLSAICRAVGVMSPKDTAELHDKPFIVKVAIKPATEQYQASNTIKGYKSKDGEPVKEKKSEPAPSSSAPAAKKKPWEKNK